MKCCHDSGYEDHSPPIFIEPPTQKFRIMPEIGLMTVLSHWLPKKNGEHKPLSDYETTLLAQLQQTNISR